MELILIVQAPLTKTNFKPQDGGVRFKEATIRNIFQMILKFLDKTLLDYLDNLADDVSQTIRVFPYKSFSETLSQVLISLLRELLHQQADLAPCFIRDIQDYIKQVFTSGSLELSSRHHDTSEREMGGQRLGALLKSQSSANIILSERRSTSSS